MLQCFLSFLNACLLTSYYAPFVWKHIFRKVSQIDVLRYFCSSERELKGQFPISLLSILTQFCDFVSIQRAGWPTCRCLDWKWNHFTRSTALHFQCAAAAWASTLCRDFGLPSAWSVTTRETESTHTSSHLITLYIMDEWGAAATRGWTEPAGGQEGGGCGDSADSKTLLPKTSPGAWCCQFKHTFEELASRRLAPSFKCSPNHPIQPMRRKLQIEWYASDWEREGA